MSAGIAPPKFVCALVTDALVIDTQILQIVHKLPAVPIAAAALDHLACEITQSQATGRIARHPAGTSIENAADSSHSMC